MQMPIGRPGAMACIIGGADAPSLSGCVKFYQTEYGVLVVANIGGLPGGSAYFALHIHEGSSCTGEGFSDAGMHYDPQGNVHPFHAGDLPPLLSCHGRAYMAVLTNRFCLKDVLGRTVVIHTGADDFTSQPAGNAGKKLACGVIFPVRVK